MMYAQYCRLETKAGGAFASNRDFIKACHSVLTKQGRSAASRDARHKWLREGLAYKQQAADLFININRGNI